MAEMFSSLVDRPMESYANTAVRSSLSQAEAISGPTSPICPMGAKCELRLVNAKDMLVECAMEEAGRCPSALSFGGGFFCRALWKISSTTV